MSGFVFPQRLCRRSQLEGVGHSTVIVLSDESDVEMGKVAVDSGSDPSGFVHVPQCVAGAPPHTGPLNRHLEQPVSVYADSDAVFRSCLMLQQYLPNGHPAEAVALTYLQQGVAQWSSLMQIARLLPQARNPRFADASNCGQSSSLSFTTGASARGPNVSLTQNMRLFPGVSRLLALIIQAIDPAHRFSSCTFALNTRARPHRDGHNSRQSFNLLIPCSEFEGGGIWYCRTAQVASGSIHKALRVALWMYPRRFDFGRKLCMPQCRGREID